MLKMCGGYPGTSLLYIFTFVTKCVQIFCLNSMLEILNVLKINCFTHQQSEKTHWNVTVQERGDIKLYGFKHKLQWPSLNTRGLYTPTEQSWLQPAELNFTPQPAPPLKCCLVNRCLVFVSVFGAPLASPLQPLFSFTWLVYTTAVTQLSAWTTLVSTFSSDHWEDGKQELLPKCHSHLPSRQTDSRFAIFFFFIFTKRNKTNLTQKCGNFDKNMC